MWPPRMVTPRKTTSNINCWEERRQFNWISLPPLCQQNLREDCEGLQKAQHQNCTQAHPDVVKCPVYQEERQDPRLWQGRSCVLSQMQRVRRRVCRRNWEVLERKNSWPPHGSCFVLGPDVNTNKFYKGKILWSVFNPYLSWSCFNFNLVFFNRFSDKFWTWRC